MSLKNKLIASAFAVSAFAIAGFAQDAKPVAKEAGKDGKAKVERKFDRQGLGGMFGRHLGRVGRTGLFGIDLTEEQKTRIHQILQSNLPDPVVMSEVRTIMRAKFEGTATDAQLARLQEIKAQGKAQAREVKAQLEGVLTPEQRAQIEQKKQEMKAKMQELRDRFLQRRQQRQDEKSKVAPKTDSKVN